MSDLDLVRLDRRGAVATLRLNRPETRNALTDEMVEAIVAACRDIAADRRVRAVIVTGEGAAFCSGGNLKDMRDRAGLFGGSPAEMRDRYRQGIQRIPVAIHELEVPTIAAINGACIGAGLDLALMCDMRIAVETAHFAESFVRLGIIPGDGGAWILPRLVGPARAAELLFTGRTIDAATALDYGILSRTVSAASLLKSAEELAEQIAANPPEALRLAKRLMREGQEQGLRQHLELAASLQAIAQHVPDHREAVSALFEKRQPMFGGER